MSDYNDKIDKILEMVSSTNNLSFEEYAETRDVLSDIKNNSDLDNPEMVEKFLKFFLNDCLTMQVSIFKIESLGLNNYVEETNSLMDKAVQNSVHKELEMGLEQKQVKDNREYILDKSFEKLNDSSIDSSSAQYIEFTKNLSDNDFNFATKSFLKIINFNIERLLKSNPELSPSLKLYIDSI